LVIARWRDWFPYYPGTVKEAFSLALVKKTFFSRPVRGSIKQGFAGDSGVAANT
jgi:hypothetical protein